MSWVVTKEFADVTDCHVYKVGDSFPHDGRQISDGRLRELSTDKNKLGVPLIEKEKEETNVLEPAEKPKRRTKQKE